MAVLTDDSRREVEQALETLEDNGWHIQAYESVARYGSVELDVTAEKFANETRAKAAGVAVDE